MSNQSSPFDRRTFLAGSSILGATTALGAFASTAQAQTSSMSSLSSSSSTPGQPSPGDASLKFNSDGRFKVIQFNDTQDDHLTDERTIEFMGKVLDQEQPDFALINGDVITGGPSTNEQVYQAINNVVLPMEEREIPWALTFGNHDEDSTEEAGTSVYKPQMVDFIRQYEYNRNAVDGDVYGSSNTHLLVNGSNSNSPAFALWLLDSNDYFDTGQIAGQSTGELPGYDYIRTDQIAWYRNVSIATEDRYGQRIPGLMYFHIPTYEHRDMWFGGPYNDTDEQHEAARVLHGIEGVKNEGVYVGAFNSGIYSAVRERGDVLGIYCGHDHINTYHGNYFGVELGYGPGTGFAPYGLNDGTWDQHTLRGARVFELNENSDRVYESTRLVFAKDLGIDMNPEPQKLTEAHPFPSYVQPGA